MDRRYGGGHRGRDPLDDYGGAPGSTPIRGPHGSREHHDPYSHSPLPPSFPTSYSGQPPSSGSSSSQQSQESPTRLQLRAEVSSLKRLNEDLTAKLGAKRHRPWAALQDDSDGHAEGRCLRKAVSLFDSIETLHLAQDVHHLDPETLSMTASQITNHIRNFQSFKLLLSYVPTLRPILSPTFDWRVKSDNLAFLRNVEKKGNAARSDNVRRMKEEVATFLNQMYNPSQHFFTKSRDQRGLQNTITGRLLCPIMHDWSNEIVRAKVCAGDVDLKPRLRKTCFLGALYPRNHCLDGHSLDYLFLRSTLLVKTYCALFTGPASAEAFHPDDTVGVGAMRLANFRRSRKATKRSVAAIIGLDGRVTPRTIAYAAVILIFNLTDATQWQDEYYYINFSRLYNFVVDYFEDTRQHSEEHKKHITELLKWWNDMVFPNGPVTTEVGEDSDDEDSPFSMLRESRAVHAGEGSA
uniref:Uncharacterized protein n=1 Tax=Psilocybe cubensis TaxID=181762 RepID=A0A8H7XUS1_PSICU